MRRRTWSERDVISSVPAGHPEGEGGEGSTGRPLVFGGEGGGENVQAPARIVQEVATFGGEGGGENLSSDERLKEDISSIGSTAHGLPLYRFRYKGAEGVYSGVIAQDVLNVMPEAVSVGADGFYRVNYRMLGIKMERLN